MKHSHTKKSISYPDLSNKHPMRTMAQLPPLLLLCLFLLSTTHNTSLANVVVPGNQENPSFSFPVKAHVTSAISRSLYVGADQAGAAGSFSVAATLPTMTKFIDVAQEKATINGKSDQSNPLFNQRITILSLIEPSSLGSEHLIAVAAHQPEAVYLFDSIQSVTPSLLTVPQLPDATGAVTSGIINVAAAPQGFVFAAVKPNSGNFGDADSGIALCLTEKKQTGLSFTLLDAPTGTSTTTPLPSPNLRALPIDVTTQALNIGAGNLNSINQNCVFFWHLRLSRLYIGLPITTGPNGGLALTMAYLGNNRQLVLQKIVPDTVFEDALDNKIIGSPTASSSIAVLEIKGLYTSTALDYLIVRTGAPADNTVYALPLVTKNDNSALWGTIAANNAPIKDVFTNALFRFLENPAQESAQMTTSNDLAAVVGGGPLLKNGVITELATSGDVVFATVDGNGGVYYSQALFDNTGKIKRWTTWQPYGGAAGPLVGVLFDSQSGIVTTLATTGTDATVRKTAWGKGSEDLSEKLYSLIGPVQGLFDFPGATPGLDNITVLAATYSDQVTYVQTGTIDGDGIITPTPSTGYAAETFDTGAISANLGAGGQPTVVVMRGGALETISPIAQTTIARSAESGWIFAAGHNGLAVLSNPDNTGFDSLGAGFTGLVAGMSFKVLGNYSAIKKLAHDGNFLYVLTDNQLDRITLTAAALDPESFSPITLARADQPPFNETGATFFNDIVVSDALALLASYNGLWRVGTGTNISTALNALELAWTRIAVPENFAGPITQLYARSATGLAQDVAKDTGDGHLYVLSGDRSKNRGQLNRFAIAPVTTDGVSANTVQTFPDFFTDTKTTPTTGVPSYFANFGELRDSFATEGALHLHARAQERGTVSNVKLMANQTTIGILNTITVTEVRSGFPFLGARSNLLPAGIEGGHDMASIIQNSALGTWVIGNEHGIRTLE
jgi:hypothetical protein